jgi:membrane-bound metal-dependent hydrolase YbcI (DUF457 family)
MLARDHALSGLIVWLGAGPAFAQMVHHPLTVEQMLLGAACATGAAGLPDLDEPGSSPARSLGVASQAVSHGIRELAGGHRRATHSIVALCGGLLLTWWATGSTAGVRGEAQAVIIGVLCLLAFQMMGPRIVHGHTLAGAAVGGAAGYLAVTHPALMGVWLMWAFVGGMAAHIAGDALTHGGVPLLWPAKPRWGLHLMKTGGPLERLLGLAMAIGALVLVLMDFQSLSHIHTATIHLPH